MTEKYRVTQTRYLGDSLMASAGEVVYLCTKPDFGNHAREDTDATGTLHVMVTKDKGGDYPAFSIPLIHLHKIEKPQWPS